jgi:ABC-2 type transport system permease protein
MVSATVTGAVAGRVLRLWWRDPRQRVSLLIIPVILVALVAGPSIAGFQDEVLVFAGPGVGTLVGLMMLNHTAYDGTALWTHLAVSLPGRIDRAGRALGTALWALPVVSVAAAATCVVVQRPDLLPAALGASAATVLAGLAFAAVTSVVIAFPAPPASANPFITPGGGNVVVVMQQFAGGLTVGLLSLPIYLALGFALWWRPELGWAMLIAGPAYGLLLLRLGCRVGGRYLDRYGPELLRRITPSRA